MKDYQLISDSACDLPEQLINQYHIKQVPFYISFDQENYRKDSSELTIADFYLETAASAIFPKTSPPTVMDYKNHFQAALLKNKDVLCICMSGTLSGSFQSALNAKAALEEEYPNAKMVIINSSQIGAGEGLLLIQAAKMKKKGYSLEQTAQLLSELKKTACSIIALGSLTYLQRGGGSIDSVSSIAGSLLHLKPIIQVQNGELTTCSAVRKPEKTGTKLIHILEDYFKTHTLSYKNYEFISYSGSEISSFPSFSSSLEYLIKRKLALPSFNAGVTISCHIGPIVFGGAFIKKYNA